ncbi:MAG: hypothetical protein IJW46_00480, partial [Clostridia bacterium]|nr:hypothetical protein [Clostridia bacterium]
PDYELFSQDGKAYMKITKDIVRDSSDNSLVVGPTFDSFDEMKQAFLQNGLTKQQLQELSRLVKDTKDPFAVVNLNRLYEPRLAGATKINSVEFLIDRYMLWISAESGSIGSAMLYVLPDTTFMTVEEFAQAVKNRSDNTVIGENRNISDRGAHEITYQTGISTCRQLSYTVEGEYAVYTVVETYCIDTTGTLPVNQKIPYKMQIYATGKDGICFSLDWMTLKDRPTVEEIAAIRLVEYAGNP